MNHQRTQAYRRVLHTLEELGPSKLQPGEQERIRTAADTLLFSTDLAGDAQLALEDIAILRRTLVESGRWEPATADRLTDDLRQCGPDSEPGREAA